MADFVLNGKPATLGAAPEMPLLWAMRDVAHLTGTKFGCGLAQCGASTVHVDGLPVRSFVTPLSAVAGKRVTTIEGLGLLHAEHPVQRPWQEFNDNAKAVTFHWRCRLVMS